jgi:hypothetical protein
LWGVLWRAWSAKAKVRNEKRAVWMEEHIGGLEVTVDNIQ